MNASSKIYVAGHRGMVGSAIRRALEAKGFRNLVFATRSELDLKDTQIQFTTLTPMPSLLDIETPANSRRRKANSWAALTNNNAQHPHEESLYHSKRRFNVHATQARAAGASEIRASIL